MTRTSLRLIHCLIAAIAVVLGHISIANAAISVTISTPVAGTKVTTSVAVSAFVDSPTMLKNVTAQIESSTSELSYSTSTFLWSGTLSTAGLTPGTKELSVTATDIAGTTGSSKVSIDVDGPPQIVITYPVQGDVANPTLRVKASCVDNDTSPCSSMTLKFGSGPDSNPGISGTTIDTSLALNAYEGQALDFTFTAFDTGGQRTDVHRTVYVESSATIVPTKKLPGAVLDFADTRILYLDADKTLRVHSRQDCTESIVAEGVIGARLTPGGVVYMSSGPTAVDTYEWTGTTSSRLGSNGDDFIVRGRWFLRNAGYVDGDTNLILRDLVAHTETTVTDRAGNNSNDVAANGDVVFWGSDDYNIHRYRGGVVTDLTTDGALGTRQNAYPLTDGTNVVYQVYSSAPPFKIVLIDAAGTLVPLDALRASQPMPYRDYAVAGGFVAFTRANSGGTLQVFRRNLSGSNEQLTTSGGYVDTIADNGEVMLITGNRRYRSLGPSSAPVPVSSSLGRSVFQGGVWNVVIGNTIFKVDSSGADGGGGCTPQPDGGTDDASIDARTDGGPSDAGSGEPTDSMPPDSGAPLDASATGTGGAAGRTGTAGAGGAAGGTGTAGRGGAPGGMGPPPSDDAGGGCAVAPAPIHRKLPLLGLILVLAMYERRTRSKRGPDRWNN
jgi:hypothetical protein